MYRRSKDVLAKKIPSYTLSMSFNMEMIKISSTLIPIMTVIKDEGVDNTMMMINLCRQHEPNDDNDDQILPIGPK